MRVQLVPHALAIATLLLTLAACSSNESSDSAPTGPPWEDYSIRMIAEGTPKIPMAINPAYPDEGVGGATSEVLTPAQLSVMRLDGTGERCLTCDHSDAPYAANYHLSYLPDGEHLVFISTRDRTEPVNSGLLTFGGEIYIMNREGEDPQRLTFLEGYARAVIVNHDGTALHWTQVTSDNRWHLVFADLHEENGKFSLGEIMEYRVLAGPDEPPSAHFEKRLGWVEWKNPSPKGDLWTVAATYAASMNIDTYVASLEKMEFRRITANPENEEFASWDPLGYGLGIMSGRDHYEARQLFPLPTPTLNDYSLVIFGLLVVQTGRAVPWGTDVFYLGAQGEAGMIKLVEGAEDGYLSNPGQWAPDGSNMYFGQWRVGLANPDPAGATVNMGIVEFTGRPTQSGWEGTTPVFLESATIETSPAEIVPFDINATVHTVHETIPGKVSGSLELTLEAHIDYQEMVGSSTVRYDNFNDGEYTIDGEVTGGYRVGMDLWNLDFKTDGELQFTDSVGIDYRYRQKWWVENLEIHAEVLFERPGNVETRQVTLPSSVLFGGL